MIYLYTESEAIQIVYIFIICILSIAYLFLLSRYKKTLTLLNEKAKQKQNIDILLAKLIPEQTAKELQKNGKVEIKKYETVSVLFADIKDFSKLMNNTHTHNTIDTLDEIFKSIDQIVNKNNIEKIKTIGDGYMCAGGVPTKNNTNPIEIIIAALEIQEYMKQIHQKNESYKRWKIRIGIHTGSVFAGVIGYEKLSYDIWGDTVNTSNRMETYGGTGEINISKSTYLLVKDFFDCEYRGEINTKHNMKEHMYYVKNIKAIFGNIQNRNSAYTCKLNTIKYYNIEEIILEQLRQKLPKDLYYHNVQHTINVINSVEIIADGENISEEEISILKTSALFHDTGFMLEYENHEKNSCKIASRELKKLNYSQEYINKVIKLILVTRQKTNPKNKLEQIMCDADLDYLGTKEYINISANLFRELKAYKKIRKLEEWNAMQIKFISNHQFYTDTAKENRNIDKQKQLEKLREYS